MQLTGFLDEEEWEKTNLPRESKGGTDVSRFGWMSGIQILAWFSPLTTSYVFYFTLDLTSNDLVVLIICKNLTKSDRQFNLKITWDEYSKFAKKKIAGKEMGRKLTKEGFIKVCHFVILSDDDTELNLMFISHGRICSTFRSLSPRAPRLNHTMSIETFPEREV
jgi:hypothetical protein